MESIYSTAGVYVDPTLRCRKSESFGAHISWASTIIHCSHSMRGRGHSHRLDSHRCDHSQSVVKAAQKVIVSGQSGSEIALKYDQQWITVWLEHDLGMLSTV